MRVEGEGEEAAEGSGDLERGRRCGAGGGGREKEAGGVYER